MRLTAEAADVLLMGFYMPGDDTKPCTALSDFMSERCREARQAKHTMLAASAAYQQSFFFLLKPSFSHNTSFFISPNETL